VGSSIILFSAKDESQRAADREKTLSPTPSQILPKKGTGFKPLDRSLFKEPEDEEDEDLLPSIPGGIHYVPPEDGSAVELSGISSTEENKSIPTPASLPNLRPTNISAGSSDASLSSDVASGLEAGIEALKEIQALADRELGSERRSSNIGGVVIRNGGTPTAVPTTPTPQATPTPVATPRFGGQPRGFTLLYLMHPRARASVEASLETLEKADIQEVAIGVLTDGTFGKDFPYLSSILRRLNERKRNTVLTLYLTNGATQRQWDNTPIDAGFVTIEPEVFRGLIQFDPGTREDFAVMVREVKPIFELNSSLSERNQNIAIVMLEDNLDRDSYIAMRDIAKEVLGNTEVEFMRNPCLGCYSGNDADSEGDGTERHSPSSLPGLTIKDSLSFDGFGYRYPGEPEEHDDKAISFEATLSLMEKAAQKELRYVALWRKDRQGLAVQPAPHPDQRDFEAATPDEIEEDIKLLRSGLSSVE